MNQTEMKLDKLIDVQRDTNRLLKDIKKLLGGGNAEPGPKKGG